MASKCDQHDEIFAGLEVQKEVLKRIENNTIAIVEKQIENSKRISVLEIWKGRLTGIYIAIAAFVSASVTAIGLYAAFR